MTCVCGEINTRHCPVHGQGDVLHGGGPCSLCGRDPAAGFASIGDEWYCHGDDDVEPTCYMRAQQAIAVVGAFWPEILPPEVSV